MNFDIFLNYDNKFNTKNFLITKKIYKDTYEKVFLHLLLEFGKLLVLNLIQRE